MKKKIIIHISHTDISRDSRILKEIKSLKNSFSNYKIFSLGIRSAKKQQINKRNIIKDSINFNLISKKIFFLPNILKKIIIYFEFFLRTVNFAIKNKPSLVHCHDFFALPIGFFIKFLFKCKLVYDAHELECLDEINQLYFNQKSKVTFLVEKILWKKIDLFISVSPSIINWYKKNIGPKKNCTLILNSPEIDKFEKNKIKNSHIRKKIKIPRDQLLFIYVGSFDKGRSIELLLKLFSDKNISSHLIFVGYGELKKNILRFKKKKKNIHVHNAVKHSTLTKLISSADVGLCLIEKVSLSDYFSLPNKLFEYAFSNLFILGSNFPDIKKFLTDYSLGIVCRPSLRNIKNKIIELEKNFKNIKSKNKKSLNNLSWSFQSSKLISAYLKILNQ